MNNNRFLEVTEPLHRYEQEVARHWYTLPPGTRLPLSNGQSCRLLYSGRPGGPAGPDVRDVVLLQGTGWPLIGDVEFHIRASDWYIHQHQNDARYNNVIMHVVFICDGPALTIRQDGATIPLCSLYDLPLSAHTSVATTAPTWPCHTAMQQMTDAECVRLLTIAGRLRFEQKTHAFVEHLHNTQPCGRFSAYDLCLIPALAEGLGYGRNRAFFRAVGLHLLGLSPEGEVPEPLGHTAEPPDLDANRLHVLRTLIEQWNTHGAWESLRQVLFTASDSTSTQLFFKLRGCFGELSSARANILICNVVLPFMAAVALIENDSLLGEQAQKLYREQPGLPSNQITRAMHKQLQLSSVPKGACQQQGLHYIYQQTCHEKRCEECIVGNRRI